MSLKKFNILQISTTDIAGGAEKIAWNLFRAYRRRGLSSWLAVGTKLSNDSEVFVVPNDDYRGRWAHLWLAIGNTLSPLIGKVHGADRLQGWLPMIGQPKRAIEILCGHEDFNFPGTWKLLNLPPEHPNIVHCHNLHGDYFDLRVLPWLSRQVPVVLTLHDAWLLSGHCAHSFDCERWKAGCEQCPDLTIYPTIKRDATAYNWQRKRNIYTQSSFFVSTPSQWLMKKVEQSILAPAIVEARVIPNGADLTIFHPSNRREARSALGIPQDSKMLLFVGNATRSNPWRDYTTLEAAVKQAAERLPDERVILVCLGEERKPEHIGRAEVWFIGYQKEPGTVACFYQAADIYVHATKADTFPNTVLEALACGTPVVATAVGGIPEQIEDGETGFLVPPGDAKAMATRIVALMTDDMLRKRMSKKAAQDARKRFDLNQQVNAYLEWYRELVVN
jgi:glycosyltransferase involved in cell wall biosynthesis